VSEEVMIRMLDFWPRGCGFTHPLLHFI